MNTSCDIVRNLNMPTAAPKQLFTELHNGITMPLLGMGLYELNGSKAEKAILKALEIGYRLFDSAAMYNNEKELGNAIRKSTVLRCDLFVTTKLNNPDHGYEATLKAFDKSLKQLKIDYIDCYLIHWPMKGKRKETWKALEYLYKQKLVRCIGVANYLEPFLDELYGYAQILPMVNQVEFSPYLYNKTLMEKCKAKNIQLQSYTPLVKGKKMMDPKLLDIAANYIKTPAQVLLRWQLQHGLSAIPKSGHPQRLEENFQVFDFEITREDMLKLDSLNEDLRLCPNPLEML